MERVGRTIERYPSIARFYTISYIKNSETLTDMEGCLQRMQTFFAEIPYVLENKSKKHWLTCKSCGMTFFLLILLPIN
ncbi:MAG: hypothetical protein ACRCZY_12570 [Phocaeicola sp.]